MKIHQVNKAVNLAIQQGKYLELRDSWGFTYGYNPRISTTKLFSTTDKNSPKESWVKSYKLIGFMEYISIKVPFRFETYLNRLEANLNAK